MPFQGMHTSRGRGIGWGWGRWCEEEIHTSKRIVILDWYTYIQTKPRKQNTQAFCTIWLCFLFSSLLHRSCITAHAKWEILLGGRTSRWLVLLSKTTKWGKRSKQGKEGLKAWRKKKQNTNTTRNIKKKKRIQEWQNRPPHPTTTTSNNIIKRSAKWPARRTMRLPYHRPKTRFLWLAHLSTTQLEDERIKSLCCCVKAWCMKRYNVTTTNNHNRSPIQRGLNNEYMRATFFDRITLTITQ